MWLLSADGEILQGKQLWLRPGSSHLLGRTSSKLQTGERVRFIDHRSVSRKHLFLTVASVNPGDSARVYAKSVITATDCSKTGTKINGEQLKGASITLDGSKREYLITLGTFHETFKLQWKPVVFTFVVKFQKNGGSERDILENEDVKLVSEYLTNETTHVVAKKRNTVEALQALVQGKWVVSESFVLALAEACKRHRGDDGNGTSALEDDFEKHWPKEIGFITPTATEPVSRPYEYLKPDPDRAEVFRDHIFVFLSEAQHQKLLPVITSGGGKTLLCEFRAGESTAEDVVKFAKGVVGKKNARGYLLSQVSGSGGVVLVRPNDRDEGRTEEVLNHIQSELNQRMIEQSELLDAILMKDTSNFRRTLCDSTQAPVDEQIEDAPQASFKPPTLPVGTTSSIPQPPNQRSFPAHSDSPTSKIQRNQWPSSRSEHDINRQQEQPEEQSAEWPSRQRRRRIITTQSRAKFGEDFDPSQIIRPKSESPEPSQARRTQPQSDQDMDMNEEPAQAPNAKRGTRKRAALAEPENEEEEEEAEEETADQRYDRLHPAQAALKRRKFEALKMGDKSFSDATPKPSGAANLIKEEGKSKKGKKKAVDSDAEIKAKIRAQREQEEERRRLDDEAEEESRDPTKIKVDHEKMVEKFEVLTIPQTHQSRTETRADHPEWNGRQNFKRFRSNKDRNRDPKNPRQRNRESQRIIISLEEVAIKGHGLGDDYWLETGHDRHKKNKDTSQQSRSQSQTPKLRQSTPSQAPASAAPRQAAAAVGEDDVEDDEDDTHAFHRRIQRSRVEDKAATDGYDALDVPVRGVDHRLLPPRGTAASSQTLRGDASQQVGRKRPATAVGGSGPLPPSKKSRLAPPPPPPPSRQVVRTSVRKTQSQSQTQKISEDEDDDDPTAFRRKRR